jgi:nitronate monooxygenase
MSTITSLLGIRLPIIQAPMAGVQLGALAAAVSEAGGLGSLPCALINPEVMAKEIGVIRAKTSNPFNVNFFCHVPPKVDDAREKAWRERLGVYYREFGIDPATIPAGPGRAPFDDAFADALEPLRPPVVSFHFGLPAQALVRRVKGCGAKVLSSATTVDEARWLEDHGVDAVIAQGLEAGGHRGMFLTDDVSTQLGTFALLPQVVRAVKVPVIATGGISTPEGVAAAMALGAAGVQVGTAFLLCPEATSSAIHRAALKSDRTKHTALTNIFTGRPSRGMVNRSMRELGCLNPAAPAFPLATGAIAPLRAKAEAAGSGDFSALWSGQNATGCREVPAAEQVRWLMGEMGSG